MTRTTRERAAPTASGNARAAAMATTATATAATAATAATGAADGPTTVSRGTALRGLIVYFGLGIFFGLLLTKSEAVSWFRIQEMFRFDSFHMYGILCSAVLVATGSLALIRRLRPRSLGGEAIEIPPKRLGRATRYWIGGILFGLGWALTGACPGPLLALVGSGVGAIAVALLSALAGVWVYGHLRPRLPHY
ncbi:MAG: DUF6691 family protein [Gemmatimonadota bacterium]